jgi:predicted MPP superfamily phosphohydrolase
MKLPGSKISRRRFLGGVSFLAAGTFGYAHFFEAELLQVSRVSVPISSGARRPLRLLHISDLHASRVISLDYLGGAIRRALDFKPDVICVTGDFITDQYADAPGYARVLRQLSDTAPTFAVLGNHDGGQWSSGRGGHPNVEWTTSLLRDAGMVLLQNRSAPVRAGEWDLSFVGVGDPWAGNFDPAAAFATVPAAGATILLSHNPDTKGALVRHPWDLLLCGHTHGGQLRVPMIGTPFAPVRDKRYVAGLHRWEQRWLHVTKGIGNVFGMRINCPPEVSFLTLT